MKSRQPNETLTLVSKTEAESIRLGSGKTLVVDAKV